MTRTPGPQGAPTIGEIYDLWYANPAERDPARLQEILTYPVAQRLREKVQEWLG